MKKGLIYTVVFAIVLFQAKIVLGQTHSQDLKVYQFASHLSKMLPGKSTEKASGFNCSGVIDEVDKIGKMAIVALFYQNGCYTDGQYNHKNFMIDQGMVSDSEGQSSFDAYKVYEPEGKASNFLASQHCIAYKFPTKENYSVYKLNKDGINKLHDVKSSEITVGEYVLLKDLTISEISQSETFFFVPASVRISIYSQISGSVEGARIAETKLGELYKYRYETEYVPFDPERKTANTRQFFLVNNNSKVGVVWQDEKNMQILFTAFDDEFKAENTVKLPNHASSQLIAATNDDKGNLYYMVAEDRKKNNLTDLVVLFKVSNNGNLIKKSTPDVSKTGLNIYHFGNYMADMEYTNDKIGLMIGRTMFASSDGLNHQGGIAVVFDANTLEVIRNVGQTSSHSFDNYLTTNSQGEFLALDLGDNYPRGIHLHKYTESTRSSKVVYTFKTQHGTRAQSPAGRTYPLYSEISSGGKTFYKWSNDNGTYTSLGAVVELEDSYMVVFTGEPDANGNSINNARTGSNNSDPRNVGLIKVVKDFEKSSGRGSVVSDDLILSKGKVESGGFYSFGGHWSEQRNTGVVWLTNYRNNKVESAKNIKSVKLAGSEVLILWEKHSVEGYGSKYISTYAMKIDSNGNNLSGVIDIGSHVRLNRRDEPMFLNNKVFLVSGNEKEKKLELIVFSVK